MAPFFVVYFLIIQEWVQIKKVVGRTKMRISCCCYIGYFYFYHLAMSGSFKVV